MKLQLIPVVLRFLTVALVSICTAEVVATLFGYPPNSFAPRSMPGSLLSDPVLGWRRNPGTHRFGAFNTSPPQIFTVTYRGDGMRSSSETPHDGGPYIGMLGCSFIEGFGLDDHETIGWRLQALLPDRSVENFGVSGYGTYQSLLMARQLLGRYSQSPGSLLVYGFADFHAFRNIQNPGVQRRWFEEDLFPVCDSERCFVWRGKDMRGAWRRSRALSLVENAWDRFAVNTERANATRITEGLLLSMRDESVSHGVRFVIAPVSPLSDTWRDFFSEHNFEVAQCFSPELNNPEFRLPDGHPKGRWTERFSECLKRSLFPSESAR